MHYVQWFKCMCEHGRYVSNMWHSGKCWRGWLIGEWYMLTWISMWHVHDWEPYDMCLAECHMLYPVDNTWMSCVAPPEMCDLVTEWMISSWLVKLCIETYILSCIQYTYGIHTCVTKRRIHSQRIHSYHTCKWDCNDFIIYLLLNKSWKREWFTYLKMSLNMWLKRRARMMTARDMITLDS